MAASVPRLSATAEQLCHQSRLAEARTPDYGHRRADRASAEKVKEVIFQKDARRNVRNRRRHDEALF